MKIVYIILAATLLLTSCSFESDPVSDVAPDVVVSSVASEVSTAPPEQTEEVPASSMENEEAPAIIKTATITDGAHDSSAIINIYSDNTVEVINFNYDGKAPDVYIAVGNKADGGNFERVALISEKILDAQQDATLMLQLGDIEDFNAVSIYCEQYSDDFGSAVLENVV